MHCSCQCTAAGPERSRAPTDYSACPLPHLQALANGENYAPAALPPNSKASAMFALAWPQDRAPAWIGDSQLQDFIAAVKVHLPGAVMHVVRHVTECTSTCGGGGSAHHRSLLTWGSSGWGSNRPSWNWWQNKPTGGSQTPGGGQKPGGSQNACQRRVIFNTVVAHPNTELLKRLVRLVQYQPGTVWNPSKVSRAHTWQLFVSRRSDGQGCMGGFAAASSTRPLTRRQPSLTHPPALPPPVHLRNSLASWRLRA